MLSEHGNALLLQVVPEHDAEPQSYRRLADEGRVDGVFVTDLHVDDPRPALLAELGLPAVIVGPGPSRPFWPAVGVDDAPGIAAAVEHLVALGHTRIAHVAGPREMVHGAVPPHGVGDAAAARPGSRRRPASRRTSPPSPAAAATRQLLDLAEPPTAIVYANDLMAIAGLSRGRLAAASACPASCRSPATTTPSSPPTSSRR